MKITNFYGLVYSLVEIGLLYVIESNVVYLTDVGKQAVDC